MKTANYLIKEADRIERLLEESCIYCAGEHDIHGYCLNCGVAPVETDLLQEQDE